MCSCQTDHHKNTCENILAGRIIYFLNTDYLGVVKAAVFVNRTCKNATVYDLLFNLESRISIPVPVTVVRVSLQYIAYITAFVRHKEQCLLIMEKRLSAR